MGKQILPSTFQHGLKIRRGVPKFAPKNADGTYGAYIDIAPSSAMTYSQESENTSYTSKMEGIGVILDETQLSLTRSMSITCEGLKRTVLAVWLAGTLGTVAQTSASVSNEVSAYVSENGTIQLGWSGDSAGVFNVSSVVVASYEGTNAASRANSTPYAVGDFYKPATPNSHWYVCTTAGTSAASPPTFTTNGTTFTDGTATFLDLGLIAYTVDVDYTQNESLGLLFIPTTGAIGAALTSIRAHAALVTEFTDANGNFTPFRLNVSYSRAAASFDRVQVKTASQKEGRLIFVEKNPKGDDNVWVIPRCTLAPSGDADLLADEYASVEFAVNILQPPDGAAVIVDGVPLS